MDNTHLDRDAFDGLRLEHVKVGLTGDDVSLIEVGRSGKVTIGSTQGLFMMNTSRVRFMPSTLIVGSL